VPPLSQTRLEQAVTERMHQNFSRLDSSLTVGEALDWLRKHPSPARIIYFYVVDRDGRLEGVVPTRRLILSPPEAKLSEIMVGKIVAVPAEATVLEACEFFIQHRFLAFPVVDEQRRLLGVVDIDLYTDELGRLSGAAPIERLLRPLARFLHIQSASGIVLMLCTIIALVLANSSWSAQFMAFWETPVRVGFGSFMLDKTLGHWINDGLMTLFFFVVGLEIKRELVAGELSELRKAMLPIVAALGGMVVPALVYLALQWGRPTAHGWGIPMATDIAFVVGFLALLGPRVPHGLKVLLLSLAIADDIGATLVIALFLTEEVSTTALALGGAGFLVVLFLRWIGVRWTPAYFVVGSFIWVAFVKSGVHPTVAGVALGLLTPARPWLGDRVPFDAVTDMVGQLGRLAGDESAPRAELVSVLERLERILHPWVAFLVMPIFALANAGVDIGVGMLFTPVALSVAAGLLIGKPVGIVLFSWASIKAGLCRMPTEMNGKILLGAGCLAGIGFTMSLFIASLALDQEHLSEAKVGILAGSAVSAVMGFVLLLCFLPRKGEGAELVSTTIGPAAPESAVSQ
jgi:Na+:H+ antiporter, NhaA family